MTIIIKNEYFVLPFVCVLFSFGLSHCGLYDLCAFFATDGAENREEKADPERWSGWGRSTGTPRSPVHHSQKRKHGGNICNFHHGVLCN